MLKNYLKTTLRSLWKNKRFVIINMLGMGISLACCIVAYYNWDYAYSFDEDQPNREDVYRINFVRDFQGYSQHGGITPMPVSNLVIENLTQVDEVVRVLTWWGANIKLGDDFFPTPIGYVDSTFLDVFYFEMVYGDKSALADKNNILISEELALRYFGRTDVIGEPLQQIHSGNQVKDFVIAGVFKDPISNSSFEFEAFSLYENNIELGGLDESSYRSYNTTFLLIKDKSKLPGIEQSLQQYVADQNKAREDFKITRFYLEPFAGMAVNVEASEITNHMFNRAAPPPAIFAPTIMAVLILLIACFNFTNTSIAMSNRRLKEIGIRKVMGGLKKQLVVQFLLENTFLCLLALGVGLLLAEFLVPAYSNMWPFIELNYTYVDNYDFLFFLVLLTLFTGLIAGSYPAFYISGFRPTSILKGSASIKGANVFTKILLVGQYSVSIIALVMGLAFYGNAVYQDQVDLGYDKEGLISAYIGEHDDVQKFENALAGHPDITMVAGTKNHIFTNYYSDPVKYEALEREVEIMDITADYPEIMGIDIVEGRGFNKNSETDFKESVLVNQTFVEEFGWDSAIGKRLVWVDSLQFYVVGVVQDFYTTGLWEKIEPMMIRYAKEETDLVILVKAPADKLLAVDEFMQEKWKEVFPNRIYSGYFMNNELAEAQTVNDNIVALFIFLGLVALILTAIGLFSLVSLSILKRTKEIGVRKVLGASVMQIVNTINREFILIVLISSVVGAAIGYFMSGLLMGSIWYYYQDATIFTLLISLLAIIVVSGATVGFKVVAAASANPVDSLRSE